MAEKRKRRGKKIVPTTVDRPAVLDTIPRPDQWTKTKSTEELVATMKQQEEDIRTKSAALIDSQRKSVETLTHVRCRVEALNYDEIAHGLSTNHYHVVDNFLGNDLANELKHEGDYMLDNEKM